MSALVRAIAKTGADICTPVDATETVLTKLLIEDLPLMVAFGGAALIWTDYEFVKHAQKAQLPGALVTLLEVPLEGLSAAASAVLASARTVLVPALANALDGLECMWSSSATKRPAPPAGPDSVPPPKRARAVPSGVDGSGELQRSKADMRRAYSDDILPTGELVLRSLTISAGRERELLVAKSALAKFEHAAGFMRLALARYDTALEQVRPLLALTPVPIFPAYAPAASWLGLNVNRRECYINIAGGGLPGVPRTLPSINALKYTIIHELTHQAVQHHSIEFARQFEQLVRRLALSTVPAAE
jgi:hypothetical protein